MPINSFRHFARKMNLGLEWAKRCWEMLFAITIYFYANVYDLVRPLT